MRADVGSGLALIVVSVATWYVTSTFQRVPEALSQNVAPTFFPRLLLGAIIALSLILVARGLRRPASRPPVLPVEIFGTAAIFLVAVWLLPRLGALVTVSMVAGILPAYWGERRRLPVAALVVGLPLFIYLTFVLGLGMRLPRGILF